MSTLDKQARDAAAQLQEVADEIVKRTVKEKGGVPECDCLEYNGELIDASSMLHKVSVLLLQMSDALAGDSSKKQKTETAQETNAEAEENGTAEKPGPEHWGHVSPDTCERRVEDTPKAALGILESALSGLGYSVERVSDSATLGALWKRALLNEANKEASNAFKQALRESIAEVSR